MDDIVTIEQVGAILIAHCHGDLDLSSREGLRAGLPALSALQRQDAAVVVLDLSDVEFMDCSALSVLLALARDCSVAEIGLVLCGAEPIVRQLLVVLELDRVLVLVPRLEEALALAAIWSGPGHAADPVEHRLRLSLVPRLTGLSTQDGRED